MHEFGLSEVRRRFSELVERATSGEHIGITRRGKLVACLGPATDERPDLLKVFEKMEKIRKRAKNIPGVTVKSLIEGGRI
jgi:prevent-host-death family protein